MKTLELKPQARLDLLQIWVKLAEENIEVAVRFNEQLDRELARLKEFPQLGHERPDLTKSDLRFWKIFSWFLIYRLSEETVTVVRVIHTSRNIKRVLRNRN